MYKYDRNEVLKNGTKVKKGNENFGSEALLKAGDEFVEMMYSTDPKEVEEWSKKFAALKNKLKEEEKL
jgi:hypothetical protein